MKTKLDLRKCLQPLAIALIGANVKGRPNYTTIGFAGMADRNIASLGMNKAHYTNIGIKENGTFSINFPSVDMVKEVDYCGLVSGESVDKSKLFDNFYGELKTAPMIRQCPLTMECKLIQTLEFTGNEAFFGEIVATYCDNKYLTNGIIDFSKVNPIIFDTHQRSYWKLGEKFAPAWSIGKEIETR